MNINTKIICAAGVLMAVSCNLNAQITTAFSFGGIANAQSNISSFSGPVLVQGGGTCLDVANGVTLFESNGSSAKGFNMDCAVAETAALIQYNVYPNPAFSYTNIIATGKAQMNQRFRLSVIDINGAIVYTSTGFLSELYAGKPLSLAQYAGGLYLLKITTPNHTTTLKLIKAN
jgi:hypothetical protein